MVFHKCDRCKEECIPHEVAGYEFCDRCYKRFNNFLNMKDCSPEGVWDILVEHGQKDKRFHLGDTIQYSPSEVMEILRKEIEDDTGAVQ